MACSSLSVSSAPVAGQQTHNGEPFPQMLACETPSATLDDSVAWVSEHRAQLCRQASQHGAVLFRGFPLRTAEDFDRFLSAFGLENFPYEDSLSNAVRVNRTPRVFTANEAPPTVTIALHHEMAQTPLFPSKLFFFCEKPAEVGGATPLCRSDVVWERLTASYSKFAQDCQTLGVRYSHVMPSGDDPTSGMGRSWQSTLKTTTREGAEQRLQRLGYRWEWLADGSLRAVTPVLPCVRELAPGRYAFFNQLIAAYTGWKDARNDPSKSITLGDGSPLDSQAMKFAIETAEGLTFDIPWQQGDVALVDNFKTMHGRRTFSGTRKVLASLAAMERAVTHQGK
jgi:alpha-ketoglutarate-dependent taurine dioxygenase